VQEILDAVFEHGVFRPLSQPSVTEGQKVRLTVDSSVVAPPDELLAMAGQVLEGLNTEEIAEFEAIALARAGFFIDRAS